MKYGSRNLNVMPISVVDKYPVTLDDGKTIIFISDKSKEPETRKRYEQRLAYIK